MYRGEREYIFGGMGHMRLAAGLLSVSVIAMGAFGAGEADAKMKAKYYKECYAPVEEARALIPEPKADVGGTASKVGSAAGALGKIGGFGGFGGLGKVASTAATVQQYSGYVASAAELTEKMQNDYPDPADRILAYGDQLGEDAENIQAGAEHLDTAQQCYDDAYTKLVADFEAGEIKKRDAKKHHNEIRKGMIEINTVLTDAQQVMDNNLNNYNEALTNETSGMGLNLGDLATAASVANGVAGGGGIGGIGGGGSCNADMATCARRAAALRARAAGGWGGLYTANDPAGAAPTPPGGMSYAQFGIMNDLSMLGGMSSVGSMSGTAAAAVAGQKLLGEAVGGSNSAAYAAQEQAAYAQQVQDAQPPQPMLSEEMMNSLRATGVSSEKFMESYGQVAIQTEKQYTVAERVSEKAGW